MSETIKILEELNANFDVEKRDMYYWKEKKSLDGSGDSLDPDLTLVPRHMVVVRTDTQQPLAVVSSEYGVVQYRDAVSFLDEIISEGTAIFDRGYLIDDGAKLFIMMRGNEAIELAPGERIQSSFIVSTSHDCTGAIRVMFAPVYGPTNAILTPLGKGELRMRHKSKIEARVSSAKVAIKKVFGYANQYRDSFIQLASLKVNEQQARTYFEQVIEGDNTRAGNVRDKLYDLWLTNPLTSNLVSCHKTLFGCLMAVVQYADYYKTVRKSKVRSDTDARILSSLDGEGAKMKADGLAWAFKLMENGFIGARP